MSQRDDDPKEPKAVGGLQNAIADWIEPFVPAVVLLSRGTTLQARYTELIDDHAHIEHCAECLVETLSQACVQPEQLVRQMHDLATFVRDHIAVEQGVVEFCDARQLPDPWRKAWVEGRHEFDRLCADWTDFLSDWHAEAIERDLEGFRQVATDVLGRLKKRVNLETAGFYAIALQANAVGFR